MRAFLKGSTRSLRRSSLVSSPILQRAFRGGFHVGRPVPVAHLLQRVSDRLERLLPPRPSRRAERLRGLDA